MDWYGKSGTELFVKELTKGKQLQQKVAEALQAEGIAVAHNPEVVVRRNIRNAASFRGEVDLQVTSKKLPVEVKSTQHSFTGVQDFPFGAPYVTDAQSWANTENKPVAVVVISQKTGAKIVVLASTFDQWQLVHTWDAKRSIRLDVWAAPRACWMEWQDFVAWLKNAEPR